MKTLLSLFLLLLAFVGLARSVLIQSGYQFYVKPNVQPTIFEGTIPQGLAPTPTYYCIQKCSNDPTCVLGYYVYKTKMCRLYPLVPDLDLIPYPNITGPYQTKVALLLKVDDTKLDFFKQTNTLGNKKFKYIMSDNLFQVREVQE
uniref:Apple domain-containing protein n=1 Tax=Caenorhabditis tropicalis TaxID=1561998 RepID=A0A1I7UWF2_9PELO